MSGPGSGRPSGGPTPAELRRLRFQLVVSPVMAAAAGLVVGVLLLVLGGDAPLPWWPFVLGAVLLLGYVQLVGRRLAPRPQG